MPKRKFTKPALSALDLISFVESKGLQVADHPYAERCLTYVGYYRLKIYMRPFENASKRFVSGTTFEQIVEVYDFDRKLRLLCLDAIERVEVALRSHLINVMGALGGPHFYTDSSYFEGTSASQVIQKICRDGDHLSIKHYKATYSRPATPPIWCLTEASTFGQVSRIYADLAKQHRKEIAKGFGFDESICVSWFRTLSALRNTCAHHGRLWNAEMHVNAPKKAKRYASDLVDNTRCYSRLVLLRALLKEIDPNGGHGWLPDLIVLMDGRPASVNLAAMGFPMDWKTRPIWN